MTQEELLEKLNSSNWEYVSPLELDSLYDWIKLASTQDVRIASRIQVILVDARMISDEDFVNGVRRLRAV